MPEFEIRGVSNTGRLVLSHHRLSGTAHYDERVFVAELIAEGLAARTVVPDLVSTRWTAFFNDLATHWRGWAGTKSVRSAEGHLLLEATSDSTGHVKLRAGLATEPLWELWNARCTLRLEAGQLECLAKSASHFFDAA